jgi:nicotinamidase/pyrazinamidase
VGADASRYGPGTALIVVDMQNDFVHPDGSLYVQGGAEVVEVVNAEIVTARREGSPIVYTQDWHPPDTPHFVDLGGTWPPHCVRDTWGAQLHDDLDVPDHPLVVRKGTGLEDGYSGFTVYDLETEADQPTELDQLLRDRNVTRAVVIGVATDVCVKATALDAARLGYETVVVADATAAVELEAGDADRALSEMTAHGIVLAPVAA